MTWNEMIWQLVTKNLWICTESQNMKKEISDRQNSVLGIFCKCRPIEWRNRNAAESGFSSITAADCVCIGYRLLWRFIYIWIVQNIIWWIAFYSTISQRGDMGIKLSLGVGPKNIFWRPLLLKKGHQNLKRKIFNQFWRDMNVLVGMYLSHTTPMPTSEPKYRIFRNSSTVLSAFFQSPLHPIPLFLHAILTSSWANICLAKKINNEKHSWEEFGK